MSQTEIWIGGRKGLWMPEKEMVKTTTSRGFRTGK
jgi:hypothetical protein